MPAEHRRDTGLLRGADQEAGVGHAERREDLLLEIDLQRLVAHGLNRLADPVDIDAVFPAIARIEHQRRVERGILAFADERSSRDLLELRHRLAPDAVGETCRVSEEVAQRDRSLGGAKLRCAAGVEPLEHLGLLQLRKQLAHRLIELQLALLDQLHAGGARDRLGHRCDPEHAVRGDRGPERALVNDALLVCCNGDEARHGPRVDGLAQRLIDLPKRGAQGRIGSGGGLRTSNGDFCHRRCQRQ